MKIYLDIYSFVVAIEAKNNNLLNKLKKDFSFFLLNQEPTSANIHINLIEQKPTSNLLPKNIVPHIQNDKLIQYCHNGINYYNYHYAVLIIETNKKIDLFFHNDNRAHEICYLYILSKSGKYMDQRGLHKIHGFALSYKQHNMIFVAPSHGGKTSTFLSLLTNKHIAVYSEDTPLIDSYGKIHPFPLRIGTTSINDLKSFCKSHIYEIYRKEYGKKYLYPLTEIGNSIAKSNNKKNIIIFAIRSNQENPQFIKLSKFKTFLSLIPHMVIGIGLPMIIEFFLSPHIKDIPIRFMILCKRLFSAFMLAIHGHAYLFLLTEDIQRNSSELSAFNTKLK